MIDYHKVKLQSTCHRQSLVSGYEKMWRLDYHDQEVYVPEGSLRVVELMVKSGTWSQGREDFVWWVLFLEHTEGSWGCSWER